MFGLTRIFQKSTLFSAIAATCLVAACVPDTPISKSPMVGAPRLTGEPAAVATLNAHLSRNGLTMQPLSEPRAAAIKRFCSGNAEALVLSSEWTDAESQGCWEMGSHWSAFSSTGMASYWVPGFETKFGAIPQ